MTEKQLRKLSRTELLELLIEQTKKNAALEQEIAQCRAEKESREIKIENSGSIAEAALQLNGLFETAQQAADQYLENIRKKEEETAVRCEKLEEATKKICLEKIQQAEKESAEYWEQVSVKLEDFYQSHPGLKEELIVRRAKRKSQKNEEVNG